jgi:hypothetical protein
MQHLEVSGAVRHIYIYIYIYVIRRLKVNAVCTTNYRPTDRQTHPVVLYVLFFTPTVHCKQFQSKARKEILLFISLSGAASAVCRGGAYVLTSH